MSEKLTELRIDRDIWACATNKGREGHGQERTQLYTPKGNLCCLGFLACAAGIENGLHKAMPRDMNVRHHSKFETATGLPVGHAWWDQAAIINDDKDLGARERETKLRDHFRKVGIKLVIGGKYPDVLK